MAKPTPTFACRLTGEAPSAICVIELVGGQAEAWLKRNWQPASGTGSLRVDAIRYGQIKLTESAGESIVVCRTSSDRYELHCHGGKVAAESILDSMKSDGIVIRSMDEWCHEYDEDPIVAEATLALTRAKTRRTTRILLDQQRGALSRALEEIDAAIRSGDRPRAQQLYEALVIWDPIGKHLTSPFEILLCGPPNVGKSSLLNQILGYQRAIVHEQAGTTRDLLTEESSIDGWPVRLTDSAGIRDSSDEIEQVGVERAIQRSESADLQLILVDPKEGWTKHHQGLFESKPNQSLVVITKHDLDSRPSAEILVLPQVQPECHHVSALTGFGIPELLTAISRKLVPIEPPVGQAILFTESQRRAIADRLA